MHSEREAQIQIAQELDNMVKGIEPAKRVPWGMNGWFRQTTDWMHEVLQAHGLEVVGPVQQVRAGPWSTVLRARTSSRDYYLKCPASYLNEAAVSDTLSSIAADYVQKPLATDRERRMMITADHGEEESILSLPQADRHQVVRDLWELQRLSVGKVKELEAAGLRVYSGEWLADNLDFLLYHKEMEFLKNRDVVTKIRECKEALHMVLKVLGKVELPLTVVHGDLGS